jgi:hypothetical protein
LLHTDGRVFLKLLDLKLVFNQRELELLLSLEFGQSVFELTSLHSLDEVLLLFVNKVLNLLDSNHTIKGNLTLESTDVLGKLKELLRHKDLELAV